MKRMSSKSTAKGPLAGFRGILKVSDWGHFSASWAVPRELGEVFFEPFAVRVFRSELPPAGLRRRQCDLFSTYR